MRFFNRKPKGEQPEDIADVITTQIALAAAFEEVGPLARSLVDDIWQREFIDDIVFARMSSHLPDVMPDFAAFTIANPVADAHLKALWTIWSTCEVRGYWLGLSRLHRENVDLGRQPRHEWQAPPLEIVQPVYDALGALGRGGVQELEWMGFGALAPFTTHVMLGAICWLSSKEDQKLFPFYPAGWPHAKAMLGLQVAVGRGYARARAQQENRVMRTLLKIG